MRGRPPLSEADRKIKMTVRVRPSFKAQFLAQAAARGLTPADAHRQAVSQWVQR